MKPINQSEHQILQPSNSFVSKNQPIISTFKIIKPIGSYRELYTQGQT